MIGIQEIFIFFKDYIKENRFSKNNEKTSKSSKN